MRNMTEEERRTMPRLGTFGPIVKRNCGYTDYTVCYTGCHAWHRCEISYRRRNGELPETFSARMFITHASKNYPEVESGSGR
jgi:hypothetical protein